MSCEYCDANVDGGCRGAGSASDCLLKQFRSAASELGRWVGLTEAVRQILGQPEGWPHHGNAPLAIAATVQLLQMDVGRLSEAMAQIGSQYVTNRGDMTDVEALTAIKAIVDRALLAEDGK